MEAGLQFGIGAWEHQQCGSADTPLWWTTLLTLIQTLAPNPALTLTLTLTQKINLTLTHTFTLILALTLILTCY